MKKYYVFLFGIIFIFIFTGCSFLSFNSPISYSEFDVGSSSSETDNIIPHEEDSSSDNNDGFFRRKARFQQMKKKNFSWIIGMTRTSAI